MRLICLITGCLVLPALLSANALSFQGHLDPSNASYAVSLIYFKVNGGGEVALQSLGWSGGTDAQGALIPTGGFDPYFSLFEGADGNATFVLSQDDRSYPGNLDPLLQIYLSPGAYILAVTQSGNMSFAENLGAGTLADGFIGLGSPDFGGLTSAWAVDIVANPSGIPESQVSVEDLNTHVSSTPEPSTALLLGGALAASVMLFRRRSRAGGKA